MKHYLKSMIGIAMFLGAILPASAQEISKKNWTLIHERTADWCPFCGSWGWDMKNQILTKFGNQNVIFMAVHHSGGLTNPTADTLSDNFGGIGQPLFFVDGVNINANSGNITTKLSETQLEVDFKNSVSVLAGVGVEAKLSETNKTLEANAKVEFLEGVEDGDYYLGLYMLEDVMNVQAGRTGLQLHKNVLRQSLLNSTFGKPLKKGAIAKGTKFEVAASIQNIQAKRKDTKVLAVLWNKTSAGKYIFFNAFMATPETPSSVESPSQDEAPELKVFQNENQNIVISLPLLQSGDSNVEVTLTDLSGKTVETKRFLVYDGQPLECTLSSPQTSGLFVVSVRTNNKMVSKKIYVVAGE